VTSRFHVFVRNIRIRSDHAQQFTECSVFCTMNCCLYLQRVSESPVTFLWCDAVVFENISNRRCCGCVKWHLWRYVLSNYSTLSVDSNRVASVRGIFLTHIMTTTLLKLNYSLTIFTVHARLAVLEKLLFPHYLCTSLAFSWCVCVQDLCFRMN